MKEENARKRPKPLPATADNIRCVTLSDFGTNIPLNIEELQYVKNLYCLHESELARDSLLSQSTTEMPSS